jgi:NAD(P)H-hydrate epimerase
VQKLNAKLYTAEQVRGLDNAAIRVFKIPGYELMCRAGQVVFEVAQHHYPENKNWLIMCGPGNNAGDGYVLARLAVEAGIKATVCSMVDPEQLRGDAATAYREWHKKGGEVVLWPLQNSGSHDLVFDALLGTGIERDIEGVYRQAITFINEFGGPVVAIDIPSGLNADSGIVMGVAVEAQHSISFVGRKRGMYTADGPDHCGQVSFSSLGIPAQAYTAMADQSCVGDLLTAEYLTELLKPRARNSHKGSYGQVLAIGGAKGMSGAIRLCGEAALRSGAGKVRLATDPEHAAWVNLDRPELMVSPVMGGEDLKALFCDQPVLALGPGLGCDDWSASLLHFALKSKLVMVVDADALNLIARINHNQINEWPLQWILTPHPTEAARLLGTNTKTVQNDRVGNALKLAKIFHATIVLKGCGSVIAHHDGSYEICPFGNSGMATAGSGDVLTGIIAALLAQGLSLKQAAVAGVLAHALAGDGAAGEKGEMALIAGDIIDQLPAIWLQAARQTGVVNSTGG